MNEVARRDKIAALTERNAVAIFLAGPEPFQSTMYARRRRKNFRFLPFNISDDLKMPGMDSGAFAVGVAHHFRRLANDTRSKFGGRPFNPDGFYAAAK